MNYYGVQYILSAQISLYIFEKKNYLDLEFILGLF